MLKRSHIAASNTALYPTFTSVGGVVHYKGSKSIRENVKQNSEWPSDWWIIQRAQKDESMEAVVHEWFYGANDLDMLTRYEQNSEYVIEFEKQHVSFRWRVWN